MIKKYLIPLISFTILITNFSGCKAVTIQFGSDDSSSESSSSSIQNTSNSSTESSGSIQNSSGSSSPGSSESSSNNNDTPQVTVNINNDSVPDYGPPHPTIPQKVYYSNSYIFPYSSSSDLTKSQVASLSNCEIGIARNEIYARRGYTFDLAQFRNYFNSQAWYTPVGKNVSLNKIEEYNVGLIKAEEDRRGVVW